MKFKNIAIEQSEDASWAFQVNFTDNDGFNVAITGNSYKTKEGADSMAWMKKLEMERENSESFYNEEELEEDEL